jgi:hypothetical protein
MPRAADIGFLGLLSNPAGGLQQAIDFSSGKLVRFFSRQIVYPSERRGLDRGKG